MKKYIPIIGTISSGKSTFLKALLGINVLETGVSTTTKFVCLIQNSIFTKFYHVIPKTNSIGKFERLGEEIKGEANIRKKIEEINKDLDGKTITKDNMFYMLQIPIKYINNKKLLDNYIFLDIPGLNEFENNYIDIIFSHINLKDISFEIIIYDSTNISSDNTFDIIKNLENKKCLTKKDNLFILNKIDQVKNKEDIIDNFRNNFYIHFEDEKNKKENDAVFINIYDNIFFPMNSLLYLAETRINENFSYLLQYEYFIYLDNKQLSNNISFFDYIKNKIDLICNPQDNKKPKIILKLDELGKDELQSFNNSIEKFKSISKINKIRANIIDKELKSLYFLYKKKYYVFNHSEYYTNLQNFLNKIDSIKLLKKIPNNWKSSSSHSDKFDEKEKKLNLELFVKFEKKLRDYIKVNINNKQANPINNYFKDLNFNLSQNKLRISFIGNINVGKSTVLNSIIGRNILPTDIYECTYRGIFIRHSDSEEYQLFKMKMIRDEQNEEKFYFEVEKNPYCKGVLNIRNFLKNKNKDRNIEDEDAFFVVTGKLKIFDYILIHKYFMEKIEFIDLPGTDSKNNTFLNLKYFEQIINISNCCVYVNQPNTVEDTNSINNIFSIRHKNNNISDYMNYCLFLINKSDILDSEEDKEKIKQQLFKNISMKENDISIDDINISFFSGTNFNKFLKAFNTYVYDVEKEPLKALNEFYLDFNKNLYNAFGIKSLKQYIINEIEIIENEFELDIEEDNKIKVKNDFKQKLDDAFSNLKYQIYPKDQEAIIKKLYSVNQALKVKDFNGTIYSNEFFKKLKDVIINCEILYIENLNQNLEEYLKDIKSLKKNSGQTNRLQNTFIDEFISILEQILK